MSVKKVGRITPERIVSAMWLGIAGMLIATPAESPVVRWGLGVPSVVLFSAAFAIHWRRARMGGGRP